MTPVWQEHLQALAGRRGWRQIAILLVTFLSLVLLVGGILPHWQELRAYQWQLHWGSLLLSALAFSCSLAFMVLGWIRIMRTMQSRSTWRQDAKFFFYSWLNRRLPTPAPYLVSRVLLYEEIGVTKRVTSVGLLWENALIIASAGWLALFLLPVTPLVRNQLPRGPVVAAAAISLLILLRPSLLEALVNWTLRRLKRATLPPVVDRPIAALLLVIYGVGWFAGGVVLFFLIRAVYPVEWGAFLFVVQSWVISGLAAYLTFFLAPAGFGTRDVALAYLLSLVIPLPVAILAALLARVWLMVNEVVWALVAYKL